MSFQFGNSKDAKQKEILDEKCHVPMGSGSSASNPPYLWTTQLTYCSGIGLVYRDQSGMVKKLELFHSQSQHGDPPDQEFINTMEKFIDCIPKDETGRVLILINPGRFNTFEDDGYDIRFIKQHINTICRDKGKSVIPNENFVSIAGSTTFYINRKGEYGTLAVDGNYCEEIHKIPPIKEAKADDSSVAKLPAENPSFVNRK